LAVYEKRQKIALWVGISF